MTCSALPAQSAIRSRERVVIHSVPLIYHAERSENSRLKRRKLR